MGGTINRPSLFRTFTGWAVGIPVTLLVSAGILIWFGITRNAGAIHLGTRLWGRVILWFSGIKVHLTGTEHLAEQTSPVLIVANHQSMLDILALAGYMPIRFAWIAKDSLFKVPLLGAAMHRAGYVPVERANRENAHKSMAIASEKLQTQSIAIFPEGTRSRTGHVARFKRGASFLAVQSGVPILPVTITGSWQKLPPGEWRITPGTIYLQIDPLFDTTGKTREEIDQDLSAIRDRMAERVERSE